MRRRRAGILAVIFALAAVFAILAGPGWPGVPTATAQDDESSYWNRFKSLFVEWDDDAQPGSPQTEVCGVRGVNVEEALGDDNYDWDAVLYMEEFQVSMNDEKKFLQEGKLGPYQGR